MGSDVTWAVLWCLKKAELVPKNQAPHHWGVWAREEKPIIQLQSRVAYLYSDRPNASFVQADSAKNGCGTPQLVSKHRSID